MRILAIGMGGAGGRIVNQLYRTDRRSSKVACVQALAVDIDAESMAKLEHVPETGKLCFAPMDLSVSDDSGSGESATIDIPQITGRVQTLATGETDAILFCVGLGGSMADTLPHIIAALRASVTEPIFALVTLPCLSEGARCSAKAADDIEMIAPMLDGVIIFDNETWNHKLKPLQKTLEQPDKGLAAKLGLKKKKEPILTPRERMYSLLNDAIVRRVSLMLRAGEFRADGGLDLAEVVLDAGEVLNTMRGMGFITIGYAVEQLPSNPLDFLARHLRPTGLFSDEQNKKASRIVDLAKQAIYQEISAPCDITSAHKALILIAGPSHELSMKGFMTVRKWIDRSIAGLETRSGDYPIMSTKFIAIIIMLSGLENIPRIGELKEIRAQYRSRGSEQISAGGEPELAEGVDAGAPFRLKDEMIVLPADRKIRAAEGKADLSPVTTSPPPRTTGRDVSRNAVPRRQEPAVEHRADEPKQSIKHVLTTRQQGARPSAPATKEGQKSGASEQDRYRIEQELLKQRRLAVQGMRGKEHRKVVLQEKQENTSGTTPVRTGSSHDISGTDTGVHHQVIVKKQAAKTVVVRKKTGKRTDEEPEAEQVRPDEPGHDSLQEASLSSGAKPDADDQEMLDSWIRQVAEQKRDRKPVEEEPVRVDGNVREARDDALIHTNLKRDREVPPDEDEIPDLPVAEPPPREMKTAGKKRDRSREDEDLSWVK